LLLLDGRTSASATTLVIPSQGLTAAVIDAKVAASRRKLQIERLRYFQSWKID
jgi:hypothetical protein